MMWAPTQLVIAKHTPKIDHDSPTVGTSPCIDQIHVRGISTKVMDPALGKVEPTVYKDGKAAGIVSRVL